MTPISEVLKALYIKHGGNKSAIARKLGKIGKKQVSSQSLSKYAKGEYVPKLEFYKRWKEIFGDDIESLSEGKVSNETNDKGVEMIINTLQRALDSKEKEVQRLVDDKTVLNGDKKFLQDHLKELTANFGTLFKKPENSNGGKKIK